MPTRLKPATAREVQQICRSRGISSLYHFTPLSNLESILVNGLVSRQVLDSHDAGYTYTDAWRADGYLDAISVSIETINCRMFAAKLRESRHDWAILEISASVLWTHDCRFCWTNASSSEMSRKNGRMAGPWSLDRMFEDRAVSWRDDTSYRAANNIPSNQPTRNDAEVQVFDRIDADLIRDVTLKNKRTQTRALTAMKAAGRVLPIGLCPEAFSY